MNNTVPMSQYYQHLIADMPLGLERNVLATLLWHVGEEKAITGKELVEELRVFSEAKDLHRQIRKAIQELRMKGFLIVSSAGDHPGYFLPRHKGEFLTFVEAELTSKIESMSITKAVMTNAADEIFGPAHQEELFHVEA